MYQKIFLIFFLFLFVTECSKKEEISLKPANDKESYKIIDKKLLELEKIVKENAE